MFTVINDLKKNEEGGVLIFVGVCLAVLLGFAALTFDLGRVAATQSDMQAYADHVALAAAGELDGKPDSITRATAAAAQLIDDSQSFGQGPNALGGATDYTLRFLNGLPNTDRTYGDPVDDLTDFVTNDPLQATMVEVLTRPTRVSLPFYRAFGALTDRDVDDANARARAVAGFTQYACDIAALMFCTPSDTSLLAPGTSLRLRSGGQGAAWGAGNFGFLDPAQEAIDPNGPCYGLTGVSQNTCLIASSGNRTRCFAQRGVDLEPGQNVGIENAVFNTRFDMYNATMNGNRNNPIYAPAPHTVTGLQSGSGNGNGNGNNQGGGGNQCLGNNTEPSIDTMAFPPDDCFSDSSCGDENRFGDADWLEGREEYVLTNYGVDLVDDPHPAAETRFDYYKAEIEAAAGGNILDGRSETGRASCFQGDPSDNINRRVFIAAGIDCAANNINGSAENVPVENYYEVFLIRPVGALNGSPGTFDLDVEMIGSAGGDGSGDADDGGIFRDVVELFR